MAVSSEMKLRLDKIDTLVEKGYLVKTKGVFLFPILISPQGAVVNAFLRGKYGNDALPGFSWIAFFFPFVFATYPSFVLSRNDIYVKEVVRDLNDQAVKCRISEFATERMRSHISPGYSLYITYIPEGQNECTVYKSVPRNFKGGLRSILFWNRNLDATWFQIELDQTTGIAKKICGDSSKPGCNLENTW